jgi:hypothetical protein
MPINPSLLNRASSKSEFIDNAENGLCVKALTEENVTFGNYKISEETVKYFSISLLSTATSQGSLAIPIKNKLGAIAGYVDGPIVLRPNECRTQRRRLIVPGMTKDNATGLRGVPRLYNIETIQQRVKKLIIVEDILSVWILHQCGLKDVVSTMGTSLSRKDLDVLVATVDFPGYVLILSQGNQTGERFARSVMLRLAPYFFLYWIKVTGHPMTLTENQLKACFYSI